jgi:hypothetical protein
MKARRAAIAALLSIAAFAMAQPAAAQSINDQDEMVRYAVKRGESLFSISEKYLAQRTAYLAVQRLNRIANPMAIPPGTVLKIPMRMLKAVPLDAQLAAFRGDVRIEDKGSLKPPVIGLPIREGVIVQTGKLGFLTLMLSNGSRITLPSNSRVRIVHMRRFLLTNSTDFDFALEQGRMETAVTPLKDQNSRFRLRTPIAVSAVRGTKFRIAYEEGQGPSLTEVVEGGVAVGATVASASPTLVPGGFGATASATGQVGTEKLLDAPAVLKPGKLQKDPSVRFDLTPVAAARGYHVQLAKDAGFVDIIAATRGTSPTAQFAEIPDGNYFVRAMAIAPSGLEGLSESYGIRRQLTALGASAGALGPGQYQFKWFGAGSGKRVYRFQLLAKPDATIPLIDETGLEKPEMLLSGLTPGVYFWRVGVRQFGENGMSESWTPPEKFTLSATEQ